MAERATELSTRADKWNYFLKKVGEMGYLAKEDEKRSLSETIGSYIPDVITDAVIADALIEIDTILNQYGYSHDPLHAIHEEIEKVRAHMERMEFAHPVQTGALRPPHRMED